MKEFLIRYIILCVLWSTFCWLFDSFILWEFDIENWCTLDRLLVGLSFIAMTVLSIFTWYALEGKDLITK